MYYVVTNKLYVLNSVGVAVELLVAISVMACNILVLSVLNKTIDRFLVAMYLLKGFELSEEVEATITFGNELLVGVLVYDLVVFCIVLLMR